MGTYCKAYPLSSLRGFEGWIEKFNNARKDKNSGAQGEVPRTLQTTDFLYLHENYVVTDGVFIDQNIIFDEVTPRWIEFCGSTLRFEVPAYASASNRESSK